MAKPTNRVRKTTAKRLLDEIDYQILGVFSKDARCSNKELAARVGLAPSTCLARVRRLVEEGRILGFHASLDVEALGIGLQAMVILRLEKHSTDRCAALHQHIRGLEEVAAVYHVAGRDDFLVHVMVRDTDHLRRFVVDDMAARPEVGNVETSLIFDYVRSPTLPMYREASRPSKPSSRRVRGK